MYRRIEDGFWRVLVVVDVAQAVISRAGDERPEKVRDEGMEKYANSMSGGASCLRKQYSLKVKHRSVFRPSTCPHASWQVVYKFEQPAVLLQSKS